MVQTVEQEDGTATVAAPAQGERPPVSPDVLRNLTAAERKLPEQVEAEDVFSFADEDLFAKVEQLEEAGVDVGALLSELAAMEPDHLMEVHRAIALRILQARGRAKRRQEEWAGWVERTTRSDIRRLEYVEGQLASAAFQLRERSKGKLKTLSTAAGKVATRTVAAGLRLPDEEDGMVVLAQVLAATGQLGCFRYVPVIDRAALGKLTQVIDGKVCLPVPADNAAQLRQAGVSMLTQGGEEGGDLRYFLPLPGVEQIPERMSYNVTHTWPRGAESPGREISDAPEPA
jgi:hypothetical protein